MEVLAYCIKHPIFLLYLESDICNFQNKLFNFQNKRYPVGYRIFFELLYTFSQIIFNTY